MANGRYTRSSFQAKTYPLANKYHPKAFHISMPVAHFNGAIQEYGVRVIHEKVTLCPNYIGNIESTNHPIDCPLCENSFVHYDPQEMWVLFEQNELKKAFLEQGFWDKGTALFSVPSHLEDNPDHPVYVDYFDRFTLVDLKERFYELFNKSEGDKDILRYRALDIMYLRSASKVFEVHKDFDLDDSGNIVWLTSNRPHYDLATGIGEAVTVSYLKTPVYRVIDILHDGRFIQQHLKEPSRIQYKYPQHVIVKKDFLWNKDEVRQDLRIVNVLPNGNLGPPTTPLP